ncbi:hypothetical protein TNCV_959741 [Trichonephila clavipes]|nr:hypothetical protein TNCV_959741 [Trichonephila clavipes]
MVPKNFITILETLRTFNNQPICLGKLQSKLPSSKAEAPNSLHCRSEVLSGHGIVLNSESIGVGKSVLIPKALTEAENSVFQAETVLSQAKCFRRNNNGTDIKRSI